MKTKRTTRTRSLDLLGKKGPRAEKDADNLAGRKHDSPLSLSLYDEVLFLFPQFKGILKNQGTMHALDWLRKQTRRI